MRSNSFIKTWMNVIKRKSAELYSRSSIAQKSEPALRKKLQKVQNDIFFTRLPVVS